MDLQYMQMPTVNIEKYPYKHRFLPVVYNRIKIVMMHNQAWRLERLKEKKKKKKDEKTGILSSAKQIQESRTKRNNGTYVWILITLSDSWEGLGEFWWKTGC